LILLHKGVSYWEGAWRLLPAHIEFLLVGWTVQLAMGVGFWILPRYMRGAPRGDERLVWAAYGCLNAGVLLAGLGQWPAAPAWVVITGRLSEFLAAALFASHAWPRVKPYGV
jgi:hypothetical protein